MRGHNSSKNYRLSRLLPLKMPKSITSLHKNLRFFLRPQNVILLSERFKFNYRQYFIVYNKIHKLNSICAKVFPKIKSNLRMWYHPSEKFCLPSYDIHKISFSHIILVVWNLTVFYNLNFHEQKSKLLDNSNWKLPLNIECLNYKNLVSESRTKITRLSCHTHFIEILFWHHSMHRDTKVALWKWYII